MKNIRSIQTRGVAIAGGILMLAMGFMSGLADGRQSSPATYNGVISGSVTADQGEVRAFRVRAKDTLHLISYTVFTNKGQ